MTDEKEQFRTTRFVQDERFTVETHARAFPRGTINSTRYLETTSAA